MCDFSGRLIAWMDGELAENEAAAVEQHVQGCEQCRERVAAYEEVSREFAAYCDSDAANGDRRHKTHSQAAALGTRRCSRGCSSSSAVACVAAADCQAGSSLFRRWQ